MPYNSLLREVLALEHFTDGDTEAQPAPGLITTLITRSGKGAMVRRGEGSPL